MRSGRRMASLSIAFMLQWKKQQELQLMEDPHVPYHNGPYGNGRLLARTPRNADKYREVCFLHLELLLLFIYYSNLHHQECWIFHSVASSIRGVYYRGEVQIWGLILMCLLTWCNTFHDMCSFMKCLWMMMCFLLLCVFFHNGTPSKMRLLPIYVFFHDVSMIGHLLWCVFFHDVSFSMLWHLPWFLFSLMCLLPWGVFFPMCLLPWCDTFNDVSSSNMSFHDVASLIMWHLVWCVISMMCFLLWFVCFY